MPTRRTFLGALTGSVASALVPEYVLQAMRLLKDIRTGGTKPVIEGWTFWSGDDYQYATEGLRLQPPAGSNGKPVPSEIERTERELIRQARGCLFDLTDFCRNVPAALAEHYDFAQGPFEQRGWTYSTNGYILIRTKLATTDGDEQRRLPNAGEGGMLPWEQFMNSKGWTAWPVDDYEYTDHSNLPCPWCNGTGRAEPTTAIRCILCDEAGEIYDYNRSRYRTCTSCNGSRCIGGDPCDRCKGRGEGHYGRILPNGTLLQPWLDKTIAGLPNAEFSTFKGPLDPVFFRCEEGQGMVMGLRRNNHWREW